MSIDEDNTNIENEILRLAVPNISGLDLLNGGNLSSLEDLDILLFHINSSQTINQAYFPSTISLHVILTLATRLPQLNWSKEAHEHEIVKLAVEQEVVHGYTSMITFKDRSHRILSRYLQHLQQCFERNGNLDDSELFEQLRFIFKEMISQHGSKKKVRNKTHKRKDSSEHEIVLISDSEEDITLKPITKQPSLKNEQNSPTSAMKNAQLLMDRFGDSKSRKRRKKEIPTQNTKIFDDHLITHKLNPLLNDGYSLWHLIEWTFWCCKRSKIEEISKDITLDGFHESYVNYQRFVEWCLDFLILDFEILINRYRHQLEPSRTSGEDKLNSPKFRMDKVMAKEKNLLYLLIGYKSGGDRYKDIVDICLYGLVEGERVNRNPVYGRERQLLDEKYFTRMGDLNRDQRDSMSLRTKILFTVYRASTYYSSDSVTRKDISADQILNFDSNIDGNNSTYGLIKLIADKMVEIDTRINEIFFESLVQLALDEDCSIHSVEFLFMTLAFVVSEQNTEVDLNEAYELLFKLRKASQEVKVREKLTDFLESQVIGRDLAAYFELIAEELKDLIDT